MSSAFEDLIGLGAIQALQSGETANVTRSLAALDGERFRHWCLRHQVGGLAYLLLEDASLVVGAAAPPAAGLRAAYLEQWARTERLRLSLASLDGVFGEIGEEYLVLKGLPFAERYYGGYDRRATGDLDVLVRRGRAARVAEALEQRGLARRSPRYGGRSASFDHLHQVDLDLDGTGVELHHALRVHPTFRIDEDSLWSSRTPVTIQGTSYATLSDEHALLLHLLGFHTDVQIGQVQARWFADLHQLLHAIEARLDWDAFFTARGRDGTLRICVNALAVFLVLTRRDDWFPGLSAGVAARRDLVAGTPERSDYLALLRGGSIYSRKRWPLEQYDCGTAAAAAWWLSGLPRRVAAKPAAFAHDASASRAAASPWGDRPPGRAPMTMASELNVKDDTLLEARLRFGSVLALVRAERASDIDAVRELFRLRVPDSGAQRHGGDEAPDVTITIASFDAAAPASLRVPVRPVVEHPLERLVEMHEGIAHGWIDERGRAAAWLAIERDRETRPRLLHALMVLMNRLLARGGRYHVHAAAVGFENATWLFVGGKGAGKSTISLALGRAGGIVYAEDHVMLRADGRTFHAAGCDGDLHLTERTERHFFERPPEGRLVERAGVMKRRLAGSALVECRPYRETEVRGLFFPRVDGRFGVRPLAGEEALARLLEPLVERHRFVDGADRAAFIERFAALVERCETWDLSLSPDLSDLDRLAAFLSARAREAHAPTPAPAEMPPACTP